MTGVAILGYGTVGSGVYEVLKINNKSIERKTIKKSPIFSRYQF